MVIKLKNLNCNIIQTQIVTKLKKIQFWQLTNWQNLKQSFGKHNLTPWQSMRFTESNIIWAAFWDLAMYPPPPSNIAITMEPKMPFIFLFRGGGQWFTYLRYPNAEKGPEKVYILSKLRQHFFLDFCQLPPAPLDLCPIPRKMFNISKLRQKNVSQLLVWGQRSPPSWTFFFWSCFP